MLSKRRLPLIAGLCIIGGGLVCWLGYTKLPRVQDKKASPLWLAAQMSEREGEFDRAVTLYRNLTRKYLHSSFCPKAEHRIFDILGNILHRREELLEEYRWYLKKFSGPWCRLRGDEQKDVPEILYKLGFTESSFFLNFADAEQAYQRLIKKYPESIHKFKALLGLSDLYYRQNRWEELIQLNSQIIQELRKQSPDSEEYSLVDEDWLRFQNGRAYYWLNRYQEAKEEFAQISPQRQALLNGCLDYYRMGVELNPGSAEAYQRLGDFYARRKNFRLARQQWKRASDIRGRAILAAPARSGSGLAPSTTE